MAFLGFLAFLAFAGFIAIFLDDELVHIEYRRKYLPEWY